MHHDVTKVTLFVTVLWKSKAVLKARPKPKPCVKGRAKAAAAKSKSAKPKAAVKAAKGKVKAKGKQSPMKKPSAQRATKRQKTEVEKKAHCASWLKVLKVICVSLPSGATCSLENGVRSTVQPG